MAENSADKQYDIETSEHGLTEKVTSRIGSRCVVLVGMMGCGKSAIGRIAASALGLPFKDADQEIESAAQMTVPEIFAKYGEEEFRRLEEKVIDRLLHEGPMILALGGGAFLSEYTRANIAENGVSIWLRADSDLLFSRIMRRPGKRPLMQTPNPRKTLEELLEKRSPVYALANLQVQSSRSSKAATRDQLLEALKDHLVKEGETSPEKSQ